MSGTAKTTAYGIMRTVSLGYDEAIARVRDLLKAEGLRDGD